MWVTPEAQLHGVSERVWFQVRREGGEWAMSRRVWCWLPWPAQVWQEGMAGPPCWEEWVLGQGVLRGQRESVKWGFCAVSTWAPGASQEAQPLHPPL